MDNKLKFTFCDLLIIIFILVCFVGILFRSSIAGALSSAIYDDTAELSFTVQGADEAFFESITAGDVFYLENGAEFGTLMEGYTKSDSVQFSKNESGELVRSVIWGKYDISGIFTVNGRFTDSGFLCSTERIFVNSTLTLHSKQSVCTVVITEIKDVSPSDTAQ